MSESTKQPPHPNYYPTYYTAKESQTSGLWRFRIYTWDASGNHEIVIKKSEYIYKSSDTALDEAVEWAEDNNIIEIEME